MLKKLEMRIGIDIRNIGKKRTGDEAVFFNYVKNLALIDSENEYLLFTDITNEDILKMIKKDLGIKDKSNFKIISLPLSLRGVQRRGNLIIRFLGFARNDRLFNNKFIWNIWTLPRYLKKNPVDIYHTQYILPFFVPKKIKLITTIHDISFNFYPQFIKFTDLLFLKLLIPWSLKRADKIIAVSKFTKDEIVKYYKIAPEKIAVAYNAVGDNFNELDSSTSLRFARNDINSIRKKYNLPEKFILYLGTMQPRKNLPVLVEAYAKLHCHSGLEPESSRINITGSLNSLLRGNDNDNYADFKLVLAGNKNAHNFDKRINETIKKYNLGLNVAFTGYINEEDKPALYKLASLFVFPSLYEGFGMPILEAIDSGTPAIISDIAPHREIAENAAEFFNPENSEELAQKIKEIMADSALRNNLIIKGQEQVQKFSWQKTARIILSAYREINKN